MKGVSYRLNDFIRPQDGRSLIVDASAGLSLGALPGLEDFSQGVASLLPILDGLVCSPGQLRRLPGRTREDPGLLVRMDWTNTIRGSDFVLPPSADKRLPILTVQDALDLGAVGMVGTFLLGYAEELEAECLRTTVEWALAGQDAGLPLVVEVRADGPRVSLPDKAIELGASYALEGGADVVVVPYPGSRSLENLGAFLSVPWLLKPGSLEKASTELEEALVAGACGLWLDYTLFALPDPAAALIPLRSQVHQPAAVP